MAPHGSPCPAVHGIGEHIVPGPSWHGGGTHPCRPCTWPDGHPIVPGGDPWKRNPGDEVQIRRHLKPALGRIALERLTPQHVQALLNQKLREGLKPKTVRYLRGTLRTALNEAVRWGLIARNVAALVEGPRVERYRINPFTPD
jgi:hypothetical protein